MLVDFRRYAWVCAAAGALFFAGSLQAGLVSTVGGSGEFAPFNGSQLFGCSDAGTTTGSCSVSPPGDAFHNASGLYQANAGYGNLDVISMSSVFGGSLNGTSNASFSDTFLITGGVGSGTLVFVTEYSGLGQGNSCGGNCLLNSTVSLNTFTAHPFGPATTTNLSFSFSFGTLFNLDASVSAYSSALGHEIGIQNAHLKINSIQVRDSGGALITDYAVTTGSGAAYAFATPEPGSFVLVMAALFVLPIVRRRCILKVSATE